MSEMKEKPAALSRRQILSAAGTGVIAAAGLGIAVTRPAHADPASTAAKIKEIAGAEPQTGRVTVSGPEIAENGNTVPVTVTVDSPMTADDYVKEIHVFADENPVPEVASFRLSPQSGKGVVNFRTRLARTQHIRAVAVMSDGSTHVGAQEIKVTIGGCGG